MGAPIDQDTDGVRIKAWSFSRLTDFEKCKARAKFLYVDRIKEPARPLPPGKLEQANDRGSRIHEAAELFVRSPEPGDLITELSSFAPEFFKLRELYHAGYVSLEEDWAHNDAWEPCGWNSDDVWLRLKLDAFARISETEAVVIDYKTGKRDGNEIKHGQQGNLYQLSAFLRYPELATVHVEFWYLDQNELSHSIYTRAQGMRHLKPFNDRGLAMTTCEDFKPSPSAWNCKWCAFGPRQLGICKDGV